MAVTDPEEERIARRWLADQQVQQSEARDAEQRQVARIAQEMRDAGVEAITEDVKQFTGQIYRGMSRAAHHQRSVVHEAVDHDARTFIYGADPRESQRWAYAIFAGALIQEVLTLVGDALSVLYGPPFYADQLAPMMRRFQEMMDALDVYDLARRLGYV